jgi:hypothetical protein
MAAMQLGEDGAAQRLIDSVVQALGVKRAVGWGWADAWGHGSEHEHPPSY